MRTTLFFTPVILLGACAAWTPVIPAEPAARVYYGDLALDRADRGAPRGAPGGPPPFRPRRLRGSFMATSRATAPPVAPRRATG